LDYKFIQFNQKLATRKEKMMLLKEENGVALILALLLLVVLTFIGISSVNTTTYDLLISGNKRVSEQTFYVGEAGFNEFMGRFREGATGEIIDTNQSSPDWRLFLAKNTERAKEIGYDSANPNHFFNQSLQTELDFGVEIKHKVDLSNKVVTKGGLPIYIVKSHGFTIEGGNKVIEVEIIKRPNLDPPAAVYSKAPVNLKGSSTYIQGNDQCPVSGTYNKPGIITTTSTITESGSPTIDGSPRTETNSSKNLNLSEMVDYLKDYANFNYGYNDNETLTGYSDSWGTPTSDGTEKPLGYTGSMNIVYFNMSGGNTVKFAGGSHGAGILLVNGNLEINGGFSWYGDIIVTGGLKFTGGGEKNITGGVFAGDSADFEIDMGGNIGILYCSGVVKKLKDTVPPLKMTRWREIF
jgi:hypothetical protein